ncbi:MAG: ATP-binding protein [Bacteroidales bacterium]
MKIFKSLSIRLKLIIIVIIISAISLLACNTITLIRNISVFRQELYNNLELEAKLVADYSVPALLFDDRKGVEVILEKLRNIPFVIGGVVFDSNGKKYATFKREGHEYLTEINDIGFNLNREEKLLHINYPVKSGEELLGSISLFATTDPIREKVFEHLKWMTLIFIGYAFLALLLILILERVITRPIIQLSRTAEHITETGNLKIRLKKESSDEIGSLYESFNALLTSLEKRKDERDEAEKALLEERERLEMRVLERTRELSEAKEKAEESDRLKAAFISNFSHEVRTPLNAILGFTNLLFEKELPEEEKKYALECINDSKNNLLRIVENILEISNLDSGQFHLYYSEFDVNNAIIQTINKAYEHINERKKESVQIKVSLKNSEGLKIVSDPRRLQKVLDCLLDNAVKFTEKGVIEVGTFIEDSETIGFFIKDPGRGISEDKKDKIFERFYKIPSEEILYEGAGLGLSVSKGIIELMKGKIWVESEPGSGSTFYFTLPISAPEGYKQEYLYAIRSKINLKGKKVLIAEDNFSNYAYMAEVVKLNQMEPTYAKNGKEAFYLAKEHDFDIILMDILMPEMDGIEATRKIKAVKPHIPVIAQTAVSIYENEEDIKDLFDDYLIKPIQSKELIDKITIILNK